MGMGKPHSLREIGFLSLPYVLVVAIYLVTAILIEGYARIDSVLSLLLLSSLLGIAAVGQTLTIILGGLDLSIPALIGFAEVTVSQLYGDGWPIALVIPLVLGGAALIGACSALVIRLLNVHSLIVTMATGAIILGAILAVTQGHTTGTVPAWLTDAVSVTGHTGFIPLPASVVAWIVLTALLVFVEQRTVLGRWAYAIGSSSAAARYARLKVTAVWVAVYVISAVLAAVAGILLAGFSGASDAAVGNPYLFTTIAAVVVGGTPLLGGRGGYLRTVAGCLVVTELTTLLIGLGFDEPTQQVYLGVLIVLLVALYGREPHVRSRI